MGVMRIRLLFVCYLVSRRPGREAMQGGNIPLDPRKVYPIESNKVLIYY